MPAGRYYTIWTIGCQMNEADARYVAEELDALGYAPAAELQQADVVVLNSCVVRQSAEDRIVGRLWALKPWKEANPSRVLALMGCLVGVKPDPSLAARFPFVDVFMPPSSPGPLLDYLAGRAVDAEARAIEAARTAARHRLQDDIAPDVAPNARQPRSPTQAPVTANVPVVYGCSHACTFCIIPQRRGAEHSRPPAEIVHEVRRLASQGVREVMLLGQIVDRYGKDFAGPPFDLADLLRAVHEIDGIQRIRFLTSHPSYMTDRILRAVAELPKACEQIEVPVQSGDDAILAAMRRGYTQDDYRRLVARIREIVPGAAVHSDVIVGFPGETAGQFQRTYDLLAELKLDKVHVATYSPRPGTVSARRLSDDVPAEEKKRRWQALDALQSEVVGEINGRLSGETVEVLVEERNRSRWQGRTRTNKLVFFKHDDDWRGRIARVRITWTGPWSMIGEVAAA